MFQILVSLLMSFSASAFEGQPKDIVAMPNFSTKVHMTIADLKITDLDTGNFKCRESSCRALAEVVGEVFAQVGDVQWRAKTAWVTVDRNGDIKTPFQPSVVTFEEAETNNRLILSMEKGQDLQSLCFGQQGSAGRTCSTYKVVEIH